MQIQLRPPPIRNTRAQRIQISMGNQLFDFRFGPSQIIHSAMTPAQLQQIRQKYESEIHLGESKWQQYIKWQTVYGDTQNVVSLYQRCLLNHQDNSRIWLAYSRYHSNRRMTELAIEILDRAIHIKPQDFSLWYEKIAIYQRNYKLEQCRQVYQHLIERFDLAQHHWRYLEFEVGHSDSPKIKYMVYRLLSKFSQEYNYFRMINLLLAAQGHSDLVIWVLELGFKKICDPSELYYVRCLKMELVNCQIRRALWICRKGIQKLDIDECGRLVQYQKYLRRALQIKGRRRRLAYISQIQVRQ